MHSSNRNPFSERSWLSCFGGSPRSFRWPMLCWRDIYMIRYDPIDCVKHAVATEPRKVYRKFFSILLVLVSDPGSVSPFFRDELLAPVLHFFSVDRGERGLGGKKIVPWEKQGGQPLSNIQHGFWQCNVVGFSYRSESIILSTEANLCLLGKRIASYKFCLGRTYMYFISITMKFINEVVKGGVTIILFVVTNLVCRKEKEFVHFLGSQRGVETHKNSWMEKRCNSSSFGNGKIFGAKKGVDPYHLDLVLLPLFF